VATNPKGKKKGWYPKALEEAREQATFATERWIDAIGGDRERADPGTSQMGINAVAESVLGGIPPYETLARLYAERGTQLPRSGYEAEAAHVGLGAHRMVRWVNFGMPVYLVDKETAGMLALTDVDRLKQSDVRFPFPTFLIVLDPHSPLYMDDRGKTREVRYIWVHQYEGPKGEHVLHVTPSVDLYGLALPTPFIIEPGKDVSAWLKEAKRPQAWGAEKVTALDKDAIAASVQLVVSLAMHLQRERPTRLKPRHTVPTERLARQDLPLPGDWVPAKIQMPAEIKAALKEQGPRVQGKLTARHVVRGHWRQQAHGRGRALRKPLWIEPHWRGAGPEALTKMVKPPGEKKRGRKRGRTKNPEERRARFRRLLRQM
jgi:hypothetical protein